MRVGAEEEELEGEYPSQSDKGETLAHPGSGSIPCTSAARRHRDRSQALRSCQSGAAQATAKASGDQRRLRWLNECWLAHIARETLKRALHPHAR